MPRTRWIFCAASMSTLSVFLLLPAILRAQTEVARTAQDATLPIAGKPNEKPTGIDHGVDVLEEQVREQSEKLDKLMALVAEQQRMIAKLTSNDGASVAITRTTEAAATGGAPAPGPPGSRPSVDAR